MSLVIDVAMPRVCADPLAHFRSPEGRQVLAFFKSGAVLRAPPLASPHSWILEHADGRRVVFVDHAIHAAALKRIASCAGGDDWTFDRWVLARAQREWAKATKCAANWKMQRGRLVKRPAGLSPVAQATLRHLKQRYAMFMHPELHTAWLELNAKGLLNVSPEGGVLLSVEGSSVKVSPGPALLLKFPKIHDVRFGV